MGNTFDGCCGPADEEDGKVESSPTSSKSPKQQAVDSFWESYIKIVTQHMHATWKGEAPISDHAVHETLAPQVLALWNMYSANAEVTKAISRVLTRDVFEAGRLWLLHLMKGLAVDQPESFLREMEASEKNKEAVAEARRALHAEMPTILALCKDAVQHEVDGLLLTSDDQADAMWMKMGADTGGKVTKEAFTKHFTAAFPMTHVCDRDRLQTLLQGARRKMEDGGGCESASL